MKRRYRWISAVAVALAIVLTLRILLPYYLEIRSDGLLAEADGFTGTVDDIDVFLLTSRGQITNLLIENLESTGSAEGGTATCPEIGVDWSWWNLLRGHIYCSAHLERPQILIAETEAPEAEEEEERPPEAKRPPAPPRVDSALLLSLPEIIPFTIERLTVANGTVRYVDASKQPLIDLTLDELRILVRDITNVPSGPEVELPSSLLVQGRTPGNGRLKIEARFDPLAEAVRADLNAELTDVDMRGINDLLMVYADLDVNRGELHLWAEVTVADGNYEGYLKILMREVDVFSWRSDSGDGLFQKFWEALAGGTAEILENQPTDQQAVIIPISGDVTSAGTDLSVAISTILSNAFVQALRPGVDNRQQYEDTAEVAKER